MIREQRKKKRRRKIGLTAALILLMLLAIAFLIVWKVFTVENVVVEVELPPKFRLLALRRFSRWRDRRHAG